MCDSRASLDRELLCTAAIGAKFSDLEVNPRLQEGRRDVTAVGAGFEPGEELRDELTSRADITAKCIHRLVQHIVIAGQISLNPRMHQPFPEIGLRRTIGHVQCFRSELAARATALKCGTDSMTVSRASRSPASKLGPCAWMMAPLSPVVILSSPRGAPGVVGGIRPGHRWRDGPDDPSRSPPRTQPRGPPVLGLRRLPQPVQQEPCTAPSAPGLRLARWDYSHSAGIAMGSASLTVSRPVRMRTTQA